MGREVRRVPVDWEHPKNERGHFMPLHDKTHAEAAADYERRKAAHPESEAAAKYTFEEWDGEPPDPAYYRPDFGGHDEQAAILRGGGDPQ